VPPVRKCKDSSVVHVDQLMRFLRTLSGAFVFGSCIAVAIAQQSSVPSNTRQSLEDAWWTGPLLANSANTLPRGHFLIEPYLYDVIGLNTHTFGSSAYVEYGLANKLTVGVIPVVGYSKAGDHTSSGIDLGDISVLSQYRLTQFHENKRVPTTAIQIQQTFPTGKYDRLGTRTLDGLGTGAYTTIVALNSQTYFWLPNRRILRTRFDVSGSVSSSVDVNDVSVYGTATGFNGHAEPGKSLFIDAAWEYSMTRNWVFAFDAIYQYHGTTQVLGTRFGKPVAFNSGSSWTYGFAPGIEYNLSPSLGVIMGTRVLAPGHNSSLSVTPVIAVNFVH